jgi:hypothetical protein
MPSNKGPKLSTGMGTLRQYNAAADHILLSAFAKIFLSTSSLFFLRTYISIINIHVPHPENGSKSNHYRVVVIFRTK